ncbi:TPA: AraC family transcriptional regulator, partial [Escherichia coli]|nr:AraC family transcriptional regulator [Escherichia coli]
MIFVCSVVLADRAFTLQFAGKMLSLSAGDVLLIDDTDREDFQPHAAHIIEVRLDENIIRRYLESCGGNREADNTVSSGFIRVAFAHPALLRDVMHHLNSGGFVHPGFSEQMFFSCIAVFASKKGFLPLLLGGMLSVAGRVRHIICTDLS